MNTTADDIARTAQEIVKSMVEMHPGKSTKGALRDVSRQTSMSMGQIKRLYYLEWRTIPAHVFLNLRRAYQKYITRAIKNAEHQQMIFQQEIKKFEEDSPNVLEHIQNEAVHEQRSFLPILRGEAQKTGDHSR